MRWIEKKKKINEKNSGDASQDTRKKRKNDKRVKDA